jgi:hypothetical protein
LLLALTPRQPECYPQPYSLIVDETTDMRGQAVLAFVVVSGNLSVLLDVAFPKEPLNGVTLTQAITRFVHEHNLNPERRMRMLCTESASYALAATSRFISSYPDTVGSPCLAHIVNLCGKDIKAKFTALQSALKHFKGLFANSMARRNRLQALLRSLPSSTLPSGDGGTVATKLPMDVDTRWSSWFRLAQWMHKAGGADTMFNFVVQEMATVGTKPSLRGLHDFLAQSHVRMMLNADLQFVAEHTLELVYDLDFLQGTNACAPYVSARLEAVRFRLERYSTINPLDLVLNVTREQLGSDQAAAALAENWVGAMAAGLQKLRKHLDTHGAVELFAATRCFDPEFMAQPGNRRYHCISNLRNLTEMASPTELVRHDWAKYLLVVQEAARAIGLKRDSNESNKLRSPLAEWWHEQQSHLVHLFPIAWFYIHLPVSSAEVERAFSVLTTLEASDRLNMTDDTVRAHFMLKYNTKHFEDAEKETLE